LAHSPLAKRRLNLLSPALLLVRLWVLSSRATMTKPKAPFWVAWLALLQVHTWAAAKTASVSTRTPQVSVTRLLAHKRFLLPKADITLGLGVSPGPFLCADRLAGSAHKKGRLDAAPF